MITVANQRSSNQTADTSVADRLARRLSIQWTKSVSVECVHRLSAGLSWNTFAVEGQVAGQREDWILKLGPMKGLMAGA